MPRLRATAFLFPIFLLAASSSTESAQLHGLSYNPSDFVVAQPSCVHRLPLIRVGRVWRDKGIRHFAMLNNTALVESLNKEEESKRYNESFGYWEDDSHEKGTWRGGSVGGCMHQNLPSKVAWWLAVAMRRGNATGRCACSFVCCAFVHMAKAASGCTEAPFTCA